MHTHSALVGARAARLALLLTREGHHPELVGVAACVALGCCPRLSCLVASLAIAANAGVWCRAPSSR